VQIHTPALCSRLHWRVAVMARRTAACSKHIFLFRFLEEPGLTCSYMYQVIQALLSYLCRVLRAWITRNTRARHSVVVKPSIFRTTSLAVKTRSRLASLYSTPIDPNRASMACRLSRKVQRDPAILLFASQTIRTFRDHGYEHILPREVHVEAGASPVRPTFANLDP